MSDSLNGLSLNEVKQKVGLGLSNTFIDTYSPTISKILLRNIFSVINIVVVPLLIFLGFFGLYMEVFAFGFFILINSATSIFDEIRIKNEIDKLKKQFQIKAIVIREGKKSLISVDKIVQDDLCYASEGDSVIADGLIIKSSYLQLDESVLTGESDYIKKDPDDKVFSGSFVVTGECYYKVTSIGKDNYSNSLANATTKFEKVKSPLQKNADKLIGLLIFLAVGLGIVNFLVTNNQGLIIQDRILSLTAITALIIPQTLIFLFTLTFSISISKLFKKGVLVQRGASIENLANTDIICFDKTGTITTNKMILKDTILFDINESDFGSVYNSLSDKIFGITKTQNLLNDKYSQFKKIDYTDFTQKPFTSKDKFSYISAKFGNEYKTIVLGSFENIQKLMPKDIENEIKFTVESLESQGKRLLLGAYFSSAERIEDPFSNYSDKNIIGFAIYVIEEELNSGIKEIIENLNQQKISIKIISGDSYNSVKSIASKVGINAERIVDLSDKFIDLSSIIDDTDIFTRAKPEDKLKIISLLKSKGHTIAMVGDGVNDVLSMKASDVSIAMETSANITKSTADMVLLNNDYSKLPAIFHEGNNLIFNLRLSTELFVAKSFFAVLTAILFIFLLKPFPIHPSSTLLFSFAASSLPSYILIFSRQNISNVNKNFFREVFISSIPASTILTLITTTLHYYLTNLGIDPVVRNTIQAIQLLSGSLIFALFVINRSGKVNSKLILAGFFCIGMYIGIIQTMLPLDLSLPIISTITTILMLIIASIFIGVVLYKFILKSVKYRLVLSIFIPILVGLILAIFPFRSYYHIALLPTNSILIIVISTLIYLIYFGIVNKFRKK